MSRKGIPNGAHPARRIGRIGTEIGTDHAARKCAEMARTLGAVVVAVGSDYACWAMLPGSREETAVMALETESVLGTYVSQPERGATARLIAENIRHRMLEIGAEGMAA